MPETVKRKQVTPPPASTVHKEIRAESFVLVDSKGTERARLHLEDNYSKEGKTVLVMYDERGKERLALYASEKIAMLDIFSQNYRFGAIEQMRIGYWPEGEGKRGLGLRVYDGGINEKERLSLLVGDKGGLAIITAPNGQYASLDGDGLTIYDGATNKPLAERTAAEPLLAARRQPTETSSPRPPAVAPNIPRDIGTLYADLGKLMGEVMEHEDCAKAVSDALGDAYIELRDNYAGHIPTGLKDDFVGLAQKASAAERGQQ